MELNGFQKRALEFAVYPNQGNNLPYAVLGLCGEAGEVAEKLKKLIRDHDGKLDDEYREKMAKELSDVLWYVSTTARELGYSLDEIGEMNIEKLLSRKERNKIQGSGNDR